MLNELETGFTFTSLPVLWHPVASLTSGAGVGSLRVGTHPTQTQVTLGTLIHIWKQKDQIHQKSADKSSPVVKNFTRQQISYLHISIHQLMVQIRPCSSGKWKNLLCWCRSLKGMCSQFRTHRYLKEKQFAPINPLSEELHERRSTQWWVTPKSSNPLQTFTSFAVWGGLVTMVTSAFVGAVQIDTAAVETDSWEHTLIHIWRDDIEGKKRGHSI